jgi:IclR family acetate operon transcriptional repressor
VRNRAERRTPAYPIASVGRALALLLLFRERSTIRVADASRILGVAASTAHRLLAMLTHCGLLAQDPRTRAYSAGPALLELGIAVTAHADIQSAVHPYLESLASTFGETVHLCALRGTDVAFLSCAESTRALRAGNRVGTVLPAHATSAGKALLATLDDDAVLERYPREALPALTRRTIRTRRALLRELHKVRKRGFAINDGESEVGLIALSCVVYDRARHARGAITLSGPEVRMRNLDAARIAAAMRAACDAAGALIRYR